MRALDSISFGTEEYSLQGDRDGVRVWHTPAGDGLGLFYYDIPPDIEAALASLEEVRSFYRRSAEDAGLGILEIELVSVDRCAAIRTLFKAAQEPTGRTYLGAITLPFRDFSYVLKVQCVEAGTTGIRDAVITMKLMESGEVEIDPDEPMMVGWLEDPYDRSLRGPMTRNKSEHPQYDEHFPDHPLSRARVVLDHLEKTLQVAEEVRSRPPFEYRSAGPASRPWWKPWK